MKWEDHLNEQQLEVVVYGEGPAQVIAGPGSGKTRALTYRVAYLVIEDLAEPREILALTFTKKAGAEMKDRVDLLLTEGSAASVTATHFHSFGYKLLEAQRHRTTNEFLRRWDGNSVLADGWYQSAWRKSCVAAGVDARIHHMTAAAIVSSARNDGLELAAYRKKLDRARALNPDRVDAAAAWEAYNDFKLTAGRGGTAAAIDFDDMLVLLERELREDERLRTSIVERFRWVLVDECQDLNVVQWRVCQLIAPPPAPNLLAVGDLDQGIYAFRGARPHMMRDFERVYEATVFRLERNYRSTSSIVATAQRVIKHNTNRHPKELWTSNDRGRPPELAVVPDAAFEGEAVGALLREELMDSSGPYEPSDVAILVRCWWLTRAVEDVLLHLRIPYVILGGTGFYGRREVKDVLAYLEVGCGLDGLVGFDIEEAALRVFNTPNRYLGKVAKSTFAKMLEQTHALIASLRQAPYSQSYMRRNAITLADLFGRVTTICRNYSNEPGLAVDAVLRETGYVEWLDDHFDDSEDRKDNIAELVEAAETHDTVENLVRFAKMAAKPKEEAAAEAVQIMTIHRSKGGEWPLVVLVGCADGVLPHYREENVEEERRLSYVAMTRAEERLYLTCALTYRRQPHAPSPFLFEAGLLDRCRDCGDGEAYDPSCGSCRGRGWTKASPVVATTG